MTSLPKAVYERAAALDGFTGGVHWGRAPQDGAMPYLVLGLNASSIGTYMSGREREAIEHRPVLCQVYHTTLESVLALVADVEEAFVRESLALDTGQMMQCLKVTDDAIIDPDRDADAAEVWQGNLLLEFQVARVPGSD